ncbi:MAG TPA: DUF397 domain-containing protein [Streptosporangiaceae bacterium]|nr:DUF397 domain-containing protein [Streptosporangiaceae bacterium]
MDHINLIWRKARASGNGGANCVEVAFDSTNSAVGLIRDSKRPEAGHLTSTPQAFAALVAAIKAGRFEERLGTNNEARGLIGNRCTDRPLFRHGRPLHVAARAVTAAVLCLHVLPIIGGQTAAPALVAGITLWWLLTARADLAPSLDGRHQR